MAKVTIRFIGERGFVSWAIKKVEGPNVFFSHVELLNETETGWIGAHSEGGVQERDLHYCDGTISIQRWYGIPCTDEQSTKIMEFARSRIGTPYNFTDIIGLLLHHNLNSPDRLICSMFVFEAMIAGGVWMLNVLPRYSNLITPDTLHLSPLLIGHCDYQTEKAE